MSTSAGWQTNGGEHRVPAALLGKKTVRDREQQRNGNPAHRHRCLRAGRAHVCSAAAQKGLAEIHGLGGPLPGATLGRRQLKCPSGAGERRALDEPLRQPRGAASYCKWLMAEPAGLSSFWKFLWPVNSLFLSHSPSFPFHRCGDFF